MSMLHSAWHNPPTRPRVTKFRTIHLWAVFVPTGHGPRVETFNTFHEAVRWAHEWTPENKLERAA